jgi:hypothetical protein
MRDAAVWELLQVVFAIVEKKKRVCAVAKNCLNLDAENDKVDAGMLRR